jgi:bacterioferritin
MGKKAKEIVGMNTDELITLLNRALADEWLAYYQYWVGAKVAKGPMRPDVQKELEEHANEELEHAGMLAERIIVLGGTPLLSPDDWKKSTNCGYLVPNNPHVKKLLEQNVEGERCAIKFYSELLEKLKKGNDTISFHMIRKILSDEIEHEEDLENLLDDLALIK